MNGMKQKSELLLLHVIFMFICGCNCFNILIFLGILFALETLECLLNIL